MITTINNEHKKLNVPNKQEQNQTCLDSVERDGLSPKGNVPNLRFPEFQGEWEKCTFDKIAQYKKGPFGSALKKDIFVPQSEDTIKVYEQQNAIKKDWTLSRYYITKGYFNSHMKQFVAKAGDLIVSCAGTIGEIYELPQDAEEGVFNQALMRVQVNDEAVNKEIFITVFSSMIDKFSKIYSNGSAIKNIPPFADLKKTQVFLPCKEEQKKIAKLLALLDERIATQNKIIDKLKSLIKGLNDSLYAQYGGKVLTSFAELGTSYSGLSGKSAQDFGSGKPFITYLNVYSNNVINENEFQYVAIKDDEKQNVAEYGDVLFTLSSETPREVGIGSVYLGKEKVYLNSFCFGIHITNMEVAFPPYLSYYVSSTAFRKFIYPYAQGSTRFNLCKADFEKASIKLPTLENQKRIYSILSHIDSKIETEIQMLNLYNSQKRYLLRQMFI